MKKKSESKSSKVRRKKTSFKRVQKRNNIVFCSFILLLCSIIVRATQIFDEGMENLFLIYSNLQHQSQQNQKSEGEAIILTGISFNNVQLSFYSKPTYIVAGGDVMLSRYIGTLGKRQGYDRVFKKGNYNPLTEFENCKSDNCLLFLNLESLFSEPDNDVPMGGFDFRSNPKNIETLLQYRQDKALLLALPNNHFANGGYQGLTITKELLDKNGIYKVGAGLTQEESREIFTWRNNLIKFCLGAYSYDGKSANIRGGRVYRNGINEEEIKSDLQKMKNMNCDVKIISLHRGTEYKFSPNYGQRILAHNLINSGADLILGGHSHIPGEFELYKGKYIFYSLGNFLFDQSWGKRESGGGFDYFYDADLNKNSVPTYISMLIGLKFERNAARGIDIKLDQIEFSSTTDGIFAAVSKETKNNLLEKINPNNISF